MAFLKCLGFKIRRRSNRVVIYNQEHDGNRSGNSSTSTDSNRREVDDQKRNKDESSSVRKFSWDEVERLTMNFSKVIGSGGFSTVYLAHFPDSSLGVGRLGAIKVHIGSERLNQLFKQEVDILLRLRHENIVKLLGYCDDGEQGAMVFEYAPNGSLQEKLHGAGADAERERESSPVLSWRNRMTLAFQLAQALEYLHEKCSPQIVHGDIKASNILLDEHLNCKLCDFGFSKMGFSSMILPPSSLSSPAYSSSKQVMMGSPGYTDPNYLRTGLASKKNDIYSYGVVLLELVTGMEAFCTERGQFLTSIVGPMLRDIRDRELGAREVEDMVDPQLAGDYGLEEARAMLSISALCLAHAPTLRPSATHILHTVKDKISSISFLFSESPEKSNLVCL
ncbi:probable receptor-like protein kinase At4g10390 [Fagus crenata]